MVIGTFGIVSGQTLAGVVGPLIEVPALVALVYVSLRVRRRFFGDRVARTSEGGEGVTALGSGT